MDWTTSFEDEEFGFSEQSFCESFEAKQHGIGKTRRCLFGGSPEVSSRVRLMTSPHELVPPQPMIRFQEKSPFHLFKVKKRCEASPMHVDSAGAGSCMAKPPLSKRTPFATLDLNQKTREGSSCGSHSVKIAVQNSLHNPNLIGDFSQNCSLPIIVGKHSDLMTITPETVARVLIEKRKTHLIIDCRYPYEYLGGHIQDAENLYMTEESARRLFYDDSNLKENNCILIFYCEFSSKRAPSMYRFIRNRDRDLNKDAYPALFFPEMYIMEGGYESFFQTFKQYCDPPLYKKMLDPYSTEEFSFYRRKCKIKSSAQRLSKIKCSLKF